MNFRDPVLIGRLASRIASESKGLPEIRIMEVCGSHTQAVERFGIRRILPRNVKLISGPGCPVCITPPGEIAEAVGLSREVTVTTYGDLARVPCSAGSLSEARAKGGDVRIVYSIAEAGAIAEKNPGKTVVHIAIGFETTAQTTAAFLNSSPPENLLVLNSHRRFPPAMDALLKSGDVRIDGYLCPGHVSTVIGSDAYGFLSDKYSIPQVVAGFEPVDVMLSVLMLVRMIKKGESGVRNEYVRVVKKNGNPNALRLLQATFGEGNARWRGLGIITGSGLPFRKRFARHDARRALSLRAREEEDMPRGCICSEVLRGKIEPGKCPMFGKGCTPEKPVGPCMVSVEGACYNALRYS